MRSCCKRKERFRLTEIVAHRQPALICTWSSAMQEVLLIQRILLHCHRKSHKETSSRKRTQRRHSSEPYFKNCGFGVIINKIFVNNNRAGIYRQRKYVTSDIIKYCIRFQLDTASDIRMPIVRSTTQLAHIVHLVES